MFKFGKVDSLDKVPEKYRHMYTQVDGGFDVAEAFSAIVTDYVGVFTSLEDHRGKLTTANNESAQRRQQLKAYEDVAKSLGVEGDDLSAAMKAKIDELVSASKSGAELKINLEKIQGQFQTQLKAKDEEHQNALGKMNGTLSRYLIDQAATAALAEAKGKIAVLLPHVKTAAKVVQDGDDYVVRVVDGQGNVRMNQAGGFMGLKDLVAEYKGNPDFAANFESEVRGGGGAPPKGKQMPNPPRNAPDKSPVDKISSGIAAGMHKR